LLARGRDFGILNHLSDSGIRGWIDANALVEFILAVSAERRSAGGPLQSVQHGAENLLLRRFERKVALKGEEPWLLAPELAAVLDAEEMGACEDHAAADYQQNGANSVRSHEEEDEGDPKQEATDLEEFGRKVSLPA
jgi:hypothetical protein